MLFLTPVAIVSHFFHSAGSPHHVKIWCLACRVHFLIKIFVDDIEFVPYMLNRFRITIPVALFIAIIGRLAICNYKNLQL